MLEVRDLHTYYGDSYILQGVSLRVEPGQVVAVLGRHVVVPEVGEVVGRELDQHVGGGRFELLTGLAQEALRDQRAGRLCHLLRHRWSVWRTDDRDKLGHRPGRQRTLIRLTRPAASGGAELGPAA